MRYGFPKQHIGFMALMGAVAFAPTACTFDPPVTAGQVSATTLEAQKAYTKAMYVAEAGFEGVTKLLETSVDTGVLKGQNAANALRLYDQLKAALNKARTSKQTADAIVAQSYIADLWSTIIAIRG